MFQRRHTGSPAIYAASSALLAMLLAALFPTPAVAAATAPAPRPTVGAVYAQTNAPGGNAVAVFGRAADGSLSPPTLVPTGGAGTGASLGDQGAVALSADGRFLFAVNAGSNDVSSFAVGPDGGLTLVDRIPSGGTLPVSVAVYQNLLYVLNAGGGADNISGFVVARDGSLRALPGSTRPLSGVGTGAAQVAFSPDGDLLAVTEKATARIDTYVVGRDGRAAGPFVHASSGATPFGFGFGKRGTLIVSEAPGFVSSYRALGDGGLEVVTASAPTFQAAPCWVAVTGNGNFAYAANAGSGSITGYAVGPDGALSLLDGDGVSAQTGVGSAPVDLAVSHNSRYLYVLNRGHGSVGAYAVNADGRLIPLGPTGGLPPGMTGLAAW